MDTKTLIIIASFLALVGVGSILTGIFYKPSTLEASKSTIPTEVAENFKAWCLKYGQTQLIDSPYRLSVYFDNTKKIQSHPKSSTYTVGENQFMIYTQEEFKSIFLGLKAPAQTKNFKEYNAKPQAVTPVDWRTKNGVTQVKDQGQCGSCWAFSTTGSLESANLIFGSKTTQLFSEQQLVDCSTSYGNQGCNGGLMDYAFKYVIAQGITTESAYPYTAVDGTCKAQGGAFKISKYTDVKKKLTKPCANLQTAVAGQPVSIGVDAEQWQFYTGGIFSNCGTQLDHGVLAVGYDGTGNWIVKNSWGSSWGENGYIQLKNGNTCGICNTASFPTI